MFALRASLESCARDAALGAVPALIYFGSMRDEEIRSMTVPLSDAPTAARRWRLTVDGVEVPGARHMVLMHPDFGRVTYGLTPGGYDGWTFREGAAGGVVILPYCVVDGETIVGLVEQARPLQGGMVLNAARGFVERGELHAAAARRELLEEMGVEVTPAALVLLAGEPGNPNSAFFETASGYGVRFFAACLEPAMLRRDGKRWVFADGVIRDGESERRNQHLEQIRGARLVPWFEAAVLGDMFTNAAVARLLASLRVGAR